MTRWIVTLTAVLLLAGCQDGTWTASGGSDYRTSQLGLIYSPDPNGGAGLRTMSDSIVPEQTTENLAIGPAVEFQIGDVAADLADRVLPGSWVPLQGAPAKLYGTLALLWQTRDHGVIFLPGTEVRFFPDNHLQPYMRTEYVKPEGGSAVDEGLLTTLGAAWQF